MDLRTLALFPMFAFACASQPEPPLPQPPDVAARASAPEASSEPSSDSGSDSDSDRDSDANHDPDLDPALASEDTSAETISFDESDPDSGPAEPVGGIAPRRKKIESFQLFGTGGRGGPG